MTFAVDRINGVRLALDDRAAKRPGMDPLKKRLEAASAAVDELRKKIVATKEPGIDVMPSEGRRHDRRGAAA